MKGMKNKEKNSMCVRCEKTKEEKGASKRGEVVSMRDYSEKILTSALADRTVNQFC